VDRLVIVEDVLMFEHLVELSSSLELKDWVKD
jgi:hypothetical protein